MFLCSCIVQWRKSRILYMDEFDATHNNSRLEYETTHICGWRVKYQPGLWSHSTGLRDLLTADLREIQRLMPDNILEILRDVVIYINISYRYPGQEKNILGACCHQSSNWLEEVNLNIYYIRRFICR